MGVLAEDYIDTIEWLSDELEMEYNDPAAKIPIDKKDADIVYTINPREVKYDPRTISDAALIFYAAGANWTMPSEGWDMTNFGLFSGDDDLGGSVARKVYEKAKDLNCQKIVISECGHGYRSTRCEGPNWAGMDVEVPMESSVDTMLEYVHQGKIKVDPSKNDKIYTFHDSCNNARSCGLYEEPRELLQLVVNDFREMYPNRAENYCCTGGGGAMSMSEYSGRRLKSAKVKADQLKATGANVVVTSCHNCVDGLNDLIKHYDLEMDVVQLVNLVATALVIEPKAIEPEKVEEIAAAHSLQGYKILVTDDEPDFRIYLTTLLEDNGAEVLQASNGDDALKLAAAEKPDLITLDLSMPGQSGIEVFEQLRQNADTESIRVCVITGRPEMRKLIYERAVQSPEGYVDKPVSEEGILTNVIKILKLAE